MKFPPVIWWQCVIRTIIVLLRCVEGGYNTELLEIVINAIISAKEFNFRKEPIRNKILEFGNQRIHDFSPVSYPFFDRYGYYPDISITPKGQEFLKNHNTNGSLPSSAAGLYYHVPVKPFYEYFGLEYTSIDYNGLDGALPLDVRTDLRAAASSSQGREANGNSGAGCDSLGDVVGHDRNTCDISSSSSSSSSDSNSSSDSSSDRISSDVNSSSSSSNGGSDNSSAPIISLDDPYDIITNIGFSEHVGEADTEENLWQNQYAIFRNFHELGTPGTLYIHAVPWIRGRTWYGHGACGYEISFFQQLIIANHYQSSMCMLSTHRGKDVVDGSESGKDAEILVIYEKTIDLPFMTFEEFIKLPGMVSRYGEINALQFDIRTFNGTIQLYRTRDLSQGANNEIIMSSSSSSSSSSSLSLPSTISINEETVKEEASTICSLFNPDPMIIEPCIPEMTETLGSLLQQQHERLQRRMETSRL